MMSVEEILDKNYHELHRAFFPLLIWAWILYGFLVFFQLWFLVIFPVMMVASSSYHRNLRFISDRTVIIGGVDYHKIQEYLHQHFERDTRWFHVKYKLGFISIHRPYFRCRSNILHVWKIKQVKE